MWGFNELLPAHLMPSFSESCQVPALCLLLLLSRFSALTNISDANIRKQPLEGWLMSSDFFFLTWSNHFHRVFHWDSFYNCVTVADTLGKGIHSVLWVRLQWSSETLYYYHTYIDIWQAETKRCWWCIILICHSLMKRLLSISRLSLFDAEWL